MNQFNLFIELTRLKRPIGYMLLFWPCAWGLTLAYDFSEDIKLYFFYLILFFFGSVLMRSAGCIINDIADKEFDQKVFRTKKRPIASDKISISLGFIYSIILCLLALLVLINFNKFTIILAFCSMPLAFTYPFMKRLTYWPQLFLGITFNYGLILGWTSITGKVDIIPIIFYVGAIFWTLGYDTIYGFQDIKDDEIIGLKSTSIKFKEKAKLFLSICYLTFIFSLLIGGFLMNFNLIYFLLLFFSLIHVFLYQIRKFKTDNSEICLELFKSNNFLGLVIFTNILLGKIL
tara:strand:- start:195 stop:1061 length:867 start_codon:yes stop_codon:yes gene_type:complete